MSTRKRTGAKAGGRTGLLQSRRPGRAVAVICSLALAVGALAGCGAGAKAQDGEDISFMLDWTPNTNHVGIYTAQRQGYYKQAGVSVKILPTAQAGAETSVENGVADVGFSKLSNLAAFNAQGADLRQVFDIGQKPIGRWCSLASRTDIKTPKDFDGKTFVSFGSAEQTAVVKQMIKNAGGQGDFQRATSGTSTFATLTSGKGDFAGFYVTWEGVQADLKGPKLHCFVQSDWGVPGNPDQIGFVVSSNWLKQESHRQALRRFVQASKRGYDWALAHPDQAADILVEQAPAARIDPQQARASMERIVKEGYWTGQPGATTLPGTVDMGQAQTYLDFQQTAGSYQDGKGGKLKRAPQAKDLWTDEFVK
ncbi:ABC transporter substrate-binding protein [Bifidobacterium actinocoloniiforme]